MASKRYFEFSEGTSNKFWEVWRDGASVFTRYGKLGAAGQVTVKKLGSEADAKKLHDKLVGEKTGKGYVEGGGKKPTAKVEAPADDIVVIPEGAVRLELDNKFWQIQRTAKAVTVTSGKIGTPGKAAKKKYKGEWEARGDVGTQIRAMKKKGYLQVAAGPRFKEVSSAVNPQLEAAIVQGDDDGYMVYGDWLMEQGDPRGAMAGIKGDTKKSQAKAAAIAWKLPTFFYGPLAVFAVESAERQHPVAATWKHGWMDTLRLSAVSNELMPVSDCGELVAQLPKVTSSRLLRELTIGCPKINDQFQFAGTIEALIKALPGMPNLRRLTLGDFHSDESELSWSYLGSLKGFWKLVPRLEYLKIRAGKMTLDKIAAPELRELWIESGGVNKANLDEILKAELPKLEVLDIWMGRDRYGCDIRPKDLAKFIDGLAKRFPRLKHLGLANSQWGNEIAPLLVGSKILKQVSSLNVSMSHLTDEGMRVYAQHKDAFKHLAKLYVSRCLLEKEGIKLAKTLCKTVTIDWQDDPREHQPEEGDDNPEATWWRYSAVGE